MAFTGTAKVKSLGRCMARITGLSLGSGASGTIGLSNDSGADVNLPANFPATSDSPDLDMSDLVHVRYERADAVGLEATHIHSVKSLSPFRITVSIDLNQPSGLLDILVTYCHSSTR